MAIEEAFNFIRIDDLIATCGQPTEEQFRDARKAGYEVVINLASDGLVSSLPGEDELLASLGVEYHHIPVAWNAPHLDQLQEFEELMLENSGRMTLIHCQANYRVTAFFASFATAKLGWNHDQADALIERVWQNPRIQMEDTWMAFVAAARQRR